MCVCVCVCVFMLVLVVLCLDFMCVCFCREGDAAAQCFLSMCLFFVCLSVVVFLSGGEIQGVYS